ncbi:Sodium-coupled monocarboxylate transporter 1 [Halotydeus destructor]|nr:Sodium-coupled monocarboxylate transporter 1 [Halotydeus destructor]
MNTSDSDAHMRQLMNNFGYVDYGVFLLLLVVSGAIGAYYAIWGKQKTAADFLLGNRSLGVFPVALSLFSSFVSAIALLGFPAEVYQYGLQVWAGVLTLPIVMFVTSYFFIPVFYELGLTSSYEVKMAI